MLIGSPEESPAAVATDAAVVSVVSLLDGGRFVANRTDSLKESQNNLWHMLFPRIRYALNILIM